MKILLLAGSKGLADEGAVNISNQLCDGLSRQHETYCIPASDAPKSILKIKSFNPDIVHSVHGPSPRTFILFFVLRLFCPNASFFATLTLPTTGLFRMKPVLRMFRFIKLLSQAPESEYFFNSLGYDTHPFPHGIDTERFHPVEPYPIPELLEKELDPGKKLLMHVGHLKPVRGMDLLAKLAKINNDWQILMVGSKRFPGDPETVKMLKESGCIIFQEFIENLPALYCRADAYIFPVSNPYGAIDFPLTVLEAMACNRPIVSTRYKALPKFITGKEGVHYFDSVEQASEILNKISSSNNTINTRGQALEYSWDNVINMLIKIYQTH